jgi:thymidylate kinase/7-cyano-7-deazaguanine synthase in queuosine biosynthesis
VAANLPASTGFAPVPVFGSDRGALITLEGVWGAGKSTAAAELGRRLTAAGFHVAVLHYGPLDSVTRGLAQLLETKPLRTRTGLGGYRLPHHATVDVLMRLAREAFHHRHTYTPALAHHDAVVVDHGVYSKIAYALAVLGEQHPHEQDEELLRWVRAVADPWFLHPDLALWLDTPWPLARERAVARGHGGGNPGSVERLLFLPRYDAVYRQVVAAHPDRVRRVRVAARAVACVHTEVASHVAALLRTTLPDPEPIRSHGAASMTSQILLLSAGMDSFPAWHHLGHPPCLYFDLGHRYAAQERAAIADLAQACGVEVEISDELSLGRWEREDAIIPLRNAHLAMLAAQRADTVWCVGVKGDDTLDKSPAAFAGMSTFISGLTGRTVRVDSPFWSLTKTEIVAGYLAQGLPVEHLLLTFSCGRGDGARTHCGACSSCLRRWTSLVNNGVEAPFDTPPWRWQRVQDYYVPAMASRRYPDHRAEEFFAALAAVDHPAARTNHPGTAAQTAEAMR